MKHWMRTFSLLWPLMLAAQPWQPNVIWERNGANDSSYYGRRIIPLGDQNDDGYMDWAVNGNGAWGTPMDPVLEFFHGGPTPPADPYLTLRPANDGTERSLVGFAAGDINGDGYEDWMTGTVKLVPGYAEEIRFYFGGPQADDSADLWMRRPLNPDVGWIPLNGDFNGDGYDDIWFGDWDNDIGHILFGGAAPDTLEDWTIHDFQGFAASADINGDGLVDVLTRVYSPPGGLRVFLGSTAPDTVLDQSLDDFNYTWIANAGDLNADGTEDLFVPLRVHYGRFPLSATPDCVVDVACLGNEMQPWPLGDINGDGYDDFAATSYDCQNWTGGAAQIWLGGPWINPEPRIVIWGGTTPTDILGVRHVIGLGDVNGDGINDFGLGGNHEFLDTRGRAVVISGDTTLHLAADDFVLSPSTFILSVYPNPFNSQTRITFTLPRTGDVTLDLINLIGQRVQMMASGRHTPGEHSVTLVGDGLSSGIYFVRLAAGNLRATQKIVVIK